MKRRDFLKGVGKLGAALGIGVATDPFKEAIENNPESNEFKAKQEAKKDSELRKYNPVNVYYVYTPDDTELAEDGFWHCLRCDNLTPAGILLCDDCLPHRDKWLNEKRSEWL